MGIITSAITTRTESHFLEHRNRHNPFVIVVAKAIRTNVPKPIVNPSFGNVLTVLAVAIQVCG